MKFFYLLTNTLIFFILTLNTVQAEEGGYAGVRIGKSKFQTSNNALFNTASASHNFILSDEHNEKNSLSSQLQNSAINRIYGGYNFNRYFGLETGVSHYLRSKELGSIGIISSERYAINAIDLILKTHLPLGESDLNIYASGALAQ